MPLYEYNRSACGPFEVRRSIGAPEGARLTGEQAYLLLGAAAVEGRIGGVVDIHNACCTPYLPTEIFDFDIRPDKDGPIHEARGRSATAP